MVARDIYATTQWRRVRKLALERDGYECQIRSHVCTGRATAVDHIIPWRDGGAPYSLLNVRSCCRECNSSRVSVSKMAPVVPSREY